MGAIVLSANTIGAQSVIVPDETLGEERSTVMPAVIKDLPSDRIEGGTIRGINLFHSFEKLSVGTGRGVYFANPTGVENILSRVTGNNPSGILGRLGVLGNANLFLLNPNGIVFGPNASLDVLGSFVATTANAIGFGDRGSFSATNPSVPSELLTINPSVFLFNQLPVGQIINNSNSPTEFTSPSGSPISGLRVSDGQSLLLVGGDISMDGGRLNALGGRIELGGLSSVGTVGLQFTGNILSLNYPQNSLLANVTLANDARGAVRGAGGEILSSMLVLLPLQTVDA